ncbi:MAG: class 1 fructose-bisphosphatase [Campylobacteraceae bacterium]|nr:class 1 fructose-bisphosphatase [Campylobacteraceae bacterium]
MEDIFKTIKQSAKQIQELLMYEDTDYASTTNATGDTQLALDIRCDKLIEENLSKLENVQQIISEEKEKPLSVNKNGKYIIAYDPLDGSSLVDVNLSVGSIFGIYEDGIDGKNLVASAYVVYGPRVELVIAQKEVKLYRLQKNGEFAYIKDIKLKQQGRHNAPGGTQQNWESFHKKLVDDIFKDGYRLRYSGGMVPDLHQILLKGGGLFSYPATSDAKKGKLRLVFEVFPFAKVFECAGGEAIDGKKRLLELTPEHPHDTSPCFFGSKNEIQRVKKAYG